MPEPRGWTLEVIGFDPLSLNHHKHWRHRHQLAGEWRSEIAHLATLARMPRLERIHVALHAWPKTNGRQDADNLVATLKPCIDGLRDAGVLDDDTPDQVTWSEPKIHPSRCGGLPTRLKRWSWELVITEVIVGQLWWHVYGGEIPGLALDALRQPAPAWCTTILGESPIAPHEVPAAIEGYQRAELGYLRSFDHDPTDDERAALAPEQYRADERAS